MRVEEEFRQYLGEDFFCSPQKYFFDANFLFRSAVPFYIFQSSHFFYFLFFFIVLRFELKRKTKRWKISMALKENVLKNKKSCSYGWMSASILNESYLNFYSRREKESEYIVISIFMLYFFIFSELR